MTRPKKTAARGYGWAHQKLRAQAKKTVDQGQAYCWRCGGWIPPGSPFDLGHDDQDRSVYRGPEHVRCNRATSGRSRRSSRVPNQPPRRWTLSVKHPPSGEQLAFTLCDVCGHFTLTKTCSYACYRTRARNKYRQLAGIPLDAPLSKRGRPRTRTAW